MLPLIYPTDPNRTAILLDKEEMQDPLAVVLEFCHEMEIGDCRRMLRELVNNALTEDIGYDDHSLRSSLIDRHILLEKGLEGVFVLMDFIKARPWLLTIVKNELEAANPVQ